MIFDTLAAIAERHLQEMVPIISDARLFLFEGVPQDVLPKEQDPKLLKTLETEFFLPFSTIAIEDVATCIVLFDSEDNQKGFEGRRGFIECMPVGAPVSAFRQRDDEGIEERAAAIAKMFPPKACVVSMGYIEKISGTKGQYQFEGALHSVQILDKDNIYVGAKESALLMEPTEEGSGAALQNAMVAIEEIMYLNSPSRFVVEKIPAKVISAKKKSKKAPRIKRSDQRPQYTLLTPKQARKLMKLQQHAIGTHASPVPHERRRHIRTYRNPRFPNMMGKTIVVGSSWVGPKEAKVGKHIYKVLVDK